MRIIVQMVLLVVVALVISPLTAAPARHQPLQIRQPDGTLLTVLPCGDEWHHWVTDLEGRILVQDAEGFYRIATEAQYAEWKEQEVAGQKRRKEYYSDMAQRYSQPTAATRAMSAGATSNHLSTFPTHGKVNSLVILVQFPDKMFSQGDDVQQYFQDFMMQEGFDDLNSHGSVHDYFIDNSMGVFDPQFEVYGPVTMKESYSYYGSNNKQGNDQHAADMIIEACEALDADVDFSRFDNDGDGKIDVVYVIFAGEGENNDTQQPDLIWPHSWSIITVKGQKFMLDGKILDRYGCVCETAHEVRAGIGTFCHEFCHTLGLVDVYNTQGKNYITGDYDIMDNGFYAGSRPGSLYAEGRCPTAMTAYERYELGWLQPTTLVGNKYNYEYYQWKDTVQMDDHLFVIEVRTDSFPVFAPDTLTCLTLTNEAFLLPVKSSTADPRDGEYYIFENRQKRDWDSTLPGHGLLVWHIDYDRTIWLNNKVNTEADHLCIELVKAYNRPHAAGMASGDPYPGSKNVKSLSATTTPALLGWDTHGTGSGKNQPLNNAALSDIQEKSIARLSEEDVIIFSFTDDGPDHYTSIRTISPDETEQKIISSQPRRIWQNGQLLIVTPTGTFDLHGRMIKSR